MEKGRWRRGDEGEMEKERWRRRDGEGEMEKGRWRRGDGEGEMEVEVGRSKLRRNMGKNLKLPNRSRAGKEEEPEEAEEADRWTMRKRMNWANKLAKQKCKI